MAKIDEQVAILRAYYESLSEDMKCILEVKKKLTVIETELKELKSHHDTFWKDDKALTIYRERFNSLTKDYSEHKKKFTEFKSRYNEKFKNYAAMEAMYLDLRKQMVKNTIGILIALVLLSIGIQLGIKLIF